MKTNGIASRIISLLVTFVFLFTLVPTVTFAGGEAVTTDYTMSLFCENDTIKAGDSVILRVRLDGPMANVCFVQYSVEFDDEYVLITKGTNARQPAWWDTEWYNVVKNGEELGYITTPSAGINEGAFNVTFLHTDLLYIDPYVGDFYNATTADAGVIKCTALKDIENPAEIFTLINCDVQQIKEEILENGDVKRIRVPKTVTTVQIPDEAVTNVITLIDAIGTVELTDAFDSKIKSAEDAYGALSEAQQGKVSNYTKLTDARKAYDDLVNDAKAKAKEVDELIELIGVVSLKSERAIIDAQNKYDELDENQKKYVTKKEDLDAASEAYNTLRENAENAAANVNVLIDAIGEVSLDKGDGAIKAAEEAYEELKKSGAEVFVKDGYYEKLIKAREEYNKLVANRAIADEVIEDIEAIGEVSLATYTDAKSKIAIARNGYDALAESGIENLVDEDTYQLLLDAEAELKIVEGILSDIEEAKSLIGAIGTVTLDKGDAITDAKNAYDALSEEAQEYVTNSDVLFSSIEKYNKLVKDEEDIQEVIGAIDAIGEVTLDSEDAINSAKELYKNLDDTLKSRVTNKTVLDEAEKKLTSLKKVETVKGMIDDIGEVSLGSGEAIQSAEAAYEALTAEEKELVSNYTVLTDARTTYDELVKDAEQEELDRLAAENVDNMIAKLGDITLDSKDALEQAEAAYAKLTDDQKTYVKNLEGLNKARETYDRLVKEKEAVDAVDELILLIGEVKYTSESKQKIEDARKAYEALGDLKDRVAKYDVLVNAETRYTQLGEINDVIVLIEKIGDVSYTETCRKAIAAAEKAYAELNDNLKSEMADEYKLLVSAREEYNKLAPEISKSEEAVAGYNNNYVTIIENIDAGRLVTVNGTIAKQIVIGDKAYYVLVSSQPIEDADVVVDEAQPGQDSEIHVLGDINDDGAIDVIDAQTVLKKSVRRNDSSTEVFASDPIAYVRADVNGNGKITANDAWYIAMAIIDSDMADAFSLYGSK